MAKYRKKPVIVEAEQFLPDNCPDGVKPGLEGEYGPSVVTVHGQRTFVEYGDWIITEPDGIHHYPCKPDIFAATYEALEQQGGGNG